MQHSVGSMKGLIISTSYCLLQMHDESKLSDTIPLPFATFHAASIGAPSALHRSIIRSAQDGGNHEPPSWLPAGLYVLPGVISAVATSSYSSSAVSKRLCGRSRQSYSSTGLLQVMRIASLQTACLLLWLRPVR